MSNSKDIFKTRREKLMNSAKDGVIIIYNGNTHEPHNEEHEVYDFAYFVGADLPNSKLILCPALQNEYREILFTNSDVSKLPTKFEMVMFVSDFISVISRAMTDYNQMRETQRMLDPIVSNISFAMNHTGKKILYFNYPRFFDFSRHSEKIGFITNLKSSVPNVEVRDITPRITVMRLIKDEYEIEMMRQSAKIGAEGVIAGMKAIKIGSREDEIKSVIYSVYRKYQSEWSFMPIVGTGFNSAFVHYESNENAEIKDGDLVLMDVGSIRDFYASDISRTVPANGKFTNEQKEIYQIVLDTQEKCIEMVKTGVSIKQIHDYSLELITKAGYGKYYTHGVGHYLGMDVHDVGFYDIPLEDGMITTIEPGIYIPEKNIGVRIEDDVLVTKTGCEVLSKDAPKEVDEIEKIMRR